jgi:hypothetical protein
VNCYNTNFERKTKFVANIDSCDDIDGDDNIDNKTLLVGVLETKKNTENWKKNFNFD